jgi:hypothetical protein
MKVNFCEHCGDLYWCKRATSKFCSTNCRVAAHRGQVPPQAKDPEAEAEKLLTMLAEKHNPAFGTLKSIKARYGHNAMMAAIQAIREALQEN